MIPQIIYLVLLGIGLGIDLGKHGEPKTGKHDGLVSFIATSIIVVLLYWGGFFDPMFK